MTKSRLARSSLTPGKCHMSDVKILEAPRPTETLKVSDDPDGVPRESVGSDVATPREVTQDIRFGPSTRSATKRHRKATAWSSKMHVAHVSLTNDLEDPTHNTLAREVPLERPLNYVYTRQETKTRAD